MIAGCSGTLKFTNIWSVSVWAVDFCILFSRVVAWADGLVRPLYVSKLSKWAGAWADGLVWPLYGSKLLKWVGAWTDGLVWPLCVSKLLKWVGAWADGLVWPLYVSKLLKLVGAWTNGLVWSAKYETNPDVSKSKFLEICDDYKVFGSLQQQSWGVMLANWLVTPVPLQQNL